MHTKMMKDSEGAFGEWKQSVAPCVKCGQLSVRYRPWDSSCGGYTDYKCECTNCGKKWWEEGPDA